MNLETLVGFETLLLTGELIWEENIDSKLEIMFRGEKFCLQIDCDFSKLRGNFPTSK